MKFEYFTKEEFACSETGENEIWDVFIQRLDVLREACGFPFAITSGYRSVNHSIEAKKQVPGTHTRGIAADIAVANGKQRRIIVEKALEQKFYGIGVAKSFIHVDIRETDPVIWTY